MIGNEKAVSDTSFQNRYIDIHCHCLPFIDDGPRSVDEAVELCRGLVDDGIEAVIATPHQLGRFSECNGAEQIREVAANFREELKIKNVGLNLLVGGDVRVDERICELVEADKILTLGDGGKYILLELLPDILVDIESLLIDLNSMGIVSIISHPERHPIAKKPEILRKWLECSAHLQITAGSLIGEFGTEAKAAGWQLLSSGMAGLVATDSHNMKSRRPCMSTAFGHIRNRLGEKIARRVCIENPLKVLSGEDIEPCCFMRTRSYSYER